MSRNIDYVPKNQRHTSTKSSLFLAKNDAEHESDSCFPFDAKTDFCRLLSRDMIVKQNNYTAVPLCSFIIQNQSLEVILYLSN